MSGQPFMGGFQKTAVAQNQVYKPATNANRIVLDQGRNVSIDSTVKKPEHFCSGFFQFISFWRAIFSPPF
jgi:hypothetical protein